MKNIRAVKGTCDILAGEIEIWQEIERVVRDVMALYGYSEIRTPVFEETGLFARSIGEDTDIVGKEMYTFEDKGGRSLTLRPEGTASVVRAFIEHSLDQRGLPQSLWYMGPMFRQERPQKGRQRQFHQFGVEVIGSPSPAVDAEVMMLFDMIAERLGLGDRLFSINSIGGEESRALYRDVLVSFLGTVKDRLCDDCQRRMVTNPLRVLDCKVPSCREAVHSSGSLPKTVDYLTDSDKEHFESVRKYLDDNGVTYSVDTFLVRGFDYYTGTVFEMNCESLGAQSAVMGGGRYDALVKELGGPGLPAVGFACGMERLAIVLREAPDRKTPINTGDVTVYVVTPGAETDSRALSCAESLRRKGISAVSGSSDRSMKAQMKAASRSGASYAVIVEPEDNIVSVRHMDRSEQEKMTFDAFISRLSGD